MKKITHICNRYYEQLTNEEVPALDEQEKLEFMEKYRVQLKSLRTDTIKMKSKLQSYDIRDRREY